MSIDKTKDMKMSDMKQVKIINVGSAQTPMNFVDGLALLLIGLKLTDHLVTWTWIEVLSPLWAPYMISWFVRLVAQTFFIEEEEEE